MEKNFKNIAGSLCVYGDWFGKPMDNYHTVKCYEEKENYIRLTFNDDETLEIWDGNEIEIRTNELVIKNSSRVRWEWYYYGKPKIFENRFFIEHSVIEDNISVKTNINWYDPKFKSSLKESAVRIL